MGMDRGMVRGGAGLLVVASLLAACVSDGTGDQRTDAMAAVDATRSGVDTALSRTRRGLGDALRTPLEDLNLVRDEIPAVLEALSSPYDRINDRSCAALAEEVRTLNKALGADLDDKSAPMLAFSDRTGARVADMALGAVSDAAGDLIPFRSIVRRVTGASQHDQDAEGAQARGIRRRAFLKGIGDERGCAPPARPYAETAPFSDDLAAGEAASGSSTGAALVSADDDRD